MSERALFDEGLQAERTLLSWQRTALAFVGASLLGIKVMADAGPTVIALGATGASLGAVAYVIASVRYRTAQAQLVALGTAPRSGLALAAMSGSVLALGLACVAFVVSGA